MNETEMLVPTVGGLLDDKSLLNGTTEAEDLLENDLAYWGAVLADSRHAVHRILVPIVLLIGVFGNSITIAVMTRRHMQTSTNLYLTALAISDILYLVFMFSLSLVHTPGISHKVHWPYWHYYRYALWLADASSSTSIWLTVTFTVERYIAVCHPIKGKVFCTQSRAKKVIIGVYLICFLLTVSTPFEWVVLPDPRYNGTHLTLGSSELGSNEMYRKTFYWFSAVMFSLLPLVLLAAFNTFLILAVKRSKKQRTVMTNTPRDGQSTQENKITVMLIAVVLLALICQLPTAAMLIYTSFHKPVVGTVEQLVCLIFNNFFNLLIAVNAAVNFVFYCALSDRYRRTFLQTFCRKWYYRHSPSPSWVATTAYTNFEDGSPRASFRSSMRGSSLRTSTRSSFRGSTASTPKASPSHYSVRGLDRHSSSGGSVYLKVPARRTFGSLTLEEETIQEFNLNSSKEALQTPNQNFLLKQTFHNGEAKRSPATLSRETDSDDGRRSSTDELMINDLKITAEKEIVPHNIAASSTPSKIETDPKGGRGKGRNILRLFKLLHGKKAPSSDLGYTSSRQSILIKYQPPSLEDQTAV